MTARAHLPFIGILLLLALLYGATLQTIPNGAEHYLMADVGETQVVLNVWGTLHATGYPLYVIKASAMTNLLTALGLSPAAAPGVVSLLWGLGALGLCYALLVHLSGRPLAAAIVTGLYGLTRMVWIHHSIAEIYSFGVLLLLVLLLLALWRDPIPYRLELLALVGGLALAHHRAFITLIPALVYAVWPQLSARPRRLPWLVLLGLPGFLPYVYLPLRANAGAGWVYGEPGTLAGLWDQFIGTEASRYIGLPPSLLDNFALVNNTLLTEVTIFGLILGILGLLVARQQRAARTLLLSGLAAYLFHGFFYSDVLVALILPVTLSVAAGWLFLTDLRLKEYAAGMRPNLHPGNVGLVAVVLGVVLVVQNGPFIAGLTRDPAGQQTIALLDDVPPDSTLMIPWGMRHFAVGFARDVLGQRPDVTLVDHKADYRGAERLVTLAETFYERPLAWWHEQLGQPVALRGVAPGLVQISTAPLYADDLTGGVQIYRERLTCTADRLRLMVEWGAGTAPETDLSVFVHLLDSGGQVIAQADQSAPVSGWYPLTRWQAGEIVPDAYDLPRLPTGESIRYGLYRQLSDGSFENTVDHTLIIDCRL